jgi:single-stranded DNA-specific DHH superfamily exonuclease
MPSGPESFVDHPRYATELNHARELLLTHRQRWRIIYHYDGDGIASASSIVRALQRLGYPMQATPLVGVERERMASILHATPGPVLILDTGSSWAELLTEHPHPVVLLDHHTYPGFPHPPNLPGHVAFVNPLDWGVDGMSEMCAATLCWLFTLFLDPRNWDNAPWGLSGAIADRQHVGGFRGVNGRLVDEAIQRSVVLRHSGPPMFGDSLARALTRSIDPYLKGISTRPEAAEQFLHGGGWDPQRSPSSLTPEEERSLTTALVARLEHQGVRPEFWAVLSQDRWTIPSLGIDAQELSNLQNATGRAGVPSLGIALALGDPAARQRAEAAEADWRDGILRGLRRLEDEGVNSMSSLQWFESPETTLAGTQAGLAMNYLLDSSRPVFVFSEGGPITKVSARATLWLVGRGVDLALVCREAAGLVHGEGGGHRVASGASIPTGSRDEFLSEANRILELQLSGHAEAAA